MSKLAKFKMLIISKGVLGDSTFNIDDVDSILDQRDAEPFDAEWIRNYEVINEKKCFTDVDMQEIKTICEMVFKVVYNAVKSSDLAGYLADDFELIAKALILDYQDEWLNALVKQYTEGKIPHGGLEPVEGELAEILFARERF